VDCALWCPQRDRCVCCARPRGGMLRNARQQAPVTALRPTVQLTAFLSLQLRQRAFETAVWASRDEPSGLRSAGVRRERRRCPTANGAGDARTRTHLSRMDRPDTRTRQPHYSSSLRIAKCRHEQAVHTHATHTLRDESPSIPPRPNIKWTPHAHKSPAEIFLSLRSASFPFAQASLPLASLFIVLKSDTVPLRARMRFCTVVFHSGNAARAASNAANASTEITPCHPARCCSAPSG